MSVAPERKTAAARAALNLPSVIPDDVVVMVCQAFRLSREQLKSRCRKAALVRARFMACWVLFNRPKANGTFRSLPEVARLIGMHDHSSVIYAIKRAEAIARREPAYAELLNSLASGRLEPVCALDAAERTGSARDQRELSRKQLNQAAGDACAISRDRWGGKVCDDDLDARNRARMSISLLEALAAARLQQVAA